MSCSGSQGVLLVNGARWVVPEYISHSINAIPGADPPFRGGQSPGVLYRVNVAAYVTRQWRWDEWDNGRVWYLGFGSFVEARIVNVRGPISVTAQFGTISNIDPVSPRGIRPTRTWQRNFVGSNGVFLYHGDHAVETVNSFTISRADGLPDTGGDPPGGTPPSWQLVFSTSNGDRTYNFASAPSISFLGCSPLGFQPSSDPSSDLSPPAFHPFEGFKSPNDEKKPPWNPSEPPPRIRPPKLKEPPLPKLKKPDNSDPSDPPKRPDDDDKNCCCPELIPLSSQILRSLRNV